MNGVRNGIRSAIGLECGGVADGDEDGVASARGGHFGLLARAARGGSLAGSRPDFSKKSPKKYFWKYVSYCHKRTCNKKTFRYTVIRS